MKKLFYSSIVLLLLSSSLLAQQIEIKGKITDKESNEPLVGIAILIKGSQEGVATDIDGNFTLRSTHSVPLTLVIAGLGYIREEFAIAEINQEIQVLLRPSVLNTDEVVITASRVEESVMKSPVALTREASPILPMPGSSPWWTGLTHKLLAWESRSQIRWVRQSWT